MNTATQKLIHAAFERLDVLNNISMTRSYRDELAGLCRAEEVQRRKSCGGSKGYTTNVETAVKLFVVRDLAAFATGKRQLPDMLDALSLRSSYVRAAMLWANYFKQIKQALGSDAPALAALDYVQECRK
jgi:hypothetical protein